MVIARAPFVACVLLCLAGAFAGPRVDAQTIQGRGPQKINLNTASLQILQTLPGVTEDMARRIVAERPYGSVEQFKARSGLSASAIDRLAPLVEARPVRQPHLPPGAVPISPDFFSKGQMPAGAVTTPGPFAGAKTEKIPVPPGTVRQVPVPSDVVGKTVPATSEAPPVRDIRAALFYATLAVVLSVALIVWMRRTSPARKAAGR